MLNALVSPVYHYLQVNIQICEIKTNQWRNSTMNEKYTENYSEILEEMSEASARHFGSLDAGFLQTPGQTLGSAAEDTNSMDLNREKQVIH